MLMQTLLWSSAGKMCPPCTACQEAVDAIPCCLVKRGVWDSAQEMTLREKKRDAWKEDRQPASLTLVSLLSG
eukprot:1147417-Pelagomonas_calceolata.AAC.1